MVSKTSLRDSVRSYDWKAVDAGLAARPDLLTYRDERERNWLHVLCGTPIGKRKPNDGVKTADAKGQTAFHLMLKKGSDYEHFVMLAGYGARADIPDADGMTAAQIMARKKDERFRKLAEKLGAAPRPRGRRA